MRGKKVFDQCRHKEVTVRPATVPAVSGGPNKEYPTFQAELECPMFGKDGLRSNLTGMDGTFSNENGARNQLRRIAARTCGSCAIGRMSKVEFVTRQADELEAITRLKKARLDARAIDEEYAKAFGEAALEVDTINVLVLGEAAPPTPVPGAAESPAPPPADASPDA